MVVIGDLVEAGADLNSKGDFYWSPLHFCAQNGTADAATYSMQHGADVNFIDANGATPLHIAAKNGSKSFYASGLYSDFMLSYWFFFDSCVGQLEVAEILIKANAQVNIKDDNGLTAFCIAKAKGIYRIHQ